MNTFKYLQFAKQYGIYAGMVIIGIGLMLGGAIKTVNQSKSEIVLPHSSENVLGEQTNEVATMLMVDVAGAVVSPGVYQLSQGSRVGAAILAAGGLAADADEEYVARQINRADMVKDGMKVYVPRLTANGDATESYASNLISINSASASELEELWGIGAARAQTIIDNRPYGSAEELVSKAGLPQSILDKNEGKIGL